MADSKHGQSDQYKGWLYKWTNYIKGYQKRWFVLQNGLLSYYRWVRAEAENRARGCHPARACFLWSRRVIPFRKIFKWSYHMKILFSKKNLVMEDSYVEWSVIVTCSVTFCILYFYTGIRRRCHTHAEAPSTWPMHSYTQRTRAVLLSPLAAHRHSIWRPARKWSVNVGWQLWNWPRPKQSVLLMKVRCSHIPAMYSI